MVITTYDNSGGVVRHFIDQRYNNNVGNTCIHGCSVSLRLQLISVLIQCCTVGSTTNVSPGVIVNYCHICIKMKKN